MVKEFKGRYRFLSNFYPSEVLAPTLEHHYQATKTANLVWAAKIMQAETPQKAKVLGGKCPLINGWDDIKAQVMLELVRLKFTEWKLQVQLLGTFPMDLVEGNYWHDNFFGDCYCQSCVNTPGQNHLGKALVQVRSEILNKRR